MSMIKRGLFRLHYKTSCRDWRNESIINNIFVKTIFCREPQLPVISMDREAATPAENRFV